MSVAEDAQPSISLLFGVFPHMPATRLFEVFSPIADDFSLKLGKSVKLRSKPDFSDFEAELLAAGFDLDKDIKRSYSRNHFACMQKVLTRQADACVTARRALAHWEDVKMADRFDIIYEAPSMPHALFVVHPRVPAKDRLILQRTIVSWPDTETGKTILSRGKLLPFVVAVDADYDPVRNFVTQVPNPE